MAIEALSLEAFKKMDYYAVEKYGLSIELMMENAGLQLARLIALKASKECKITIGVGNGNNGGGGLVAARRLAAWGYDVYLDLAVDITKELPSIQLKRAVLFGVTQRLPTKTDIWVDAYLGFSQRLPLSQVFLEKITLANAATAHRISLDIPIGISEDRSEPMFKAHQVVTLAAPKKILELLPKGIAIFIADIGIPKAIYTEFDIEMPCFARQQLLKI
ncbi:MAG: NAD(P)H-hydrate epimerase [Maribacter sp.]|jgi:NAD(P)H-hydrate epimerase